VLTWSVRIKNLGIVIALFFQCMGALFDPTNRMKGGVKWGLVAHTTVMFSFLTIPAAMRFNMQSVGYIDGREFTGVAGALPPGPLGYQYSAYTKAILVVTDMTYPLNQWLADGLLVGSASNLVAWVPDVGRSSSCTVATSYIP
jgi:hypothetical protein